jgi:hypothetical protein
MTGRRTLVDPSAVSRLADILDRSRKVTTFDSEKEKEAHRLAYSLGDIEESVTKFLELLPRLMNEALTPADIEELLHEIGEEFRHIDYHMRDPRYFRYIFEAVRDADRS